jgi:hypothetical protein
MMAGLLCLIIGFMFGFIAGHIIKYNLQKTLIDNFYRQLFNQMSELNKKLIDRLNKGEEWR